MHGLQKTRYDGDRAPSLQSNKFRREGAIESVTERQDGFFLEQFQEGKFLYHSPDDLFVLLRLEAARAVNQNSARLQQWNGCANDQTEVLL